jgi:hypothetical protein
LSSGITDAYFLLPALIGNTAGFMFSSVLRNLAGDPSTNGASVGPPEGSGYYVAPFPNVIAEFCSGTSVPRDCGMANTGTSLPAYEFVDRSVTRAVVAFRGYGSIATSTVPEPEPGSLALVVLGLVACGLSVRRGWQQLRRASNPDHSPTTGPQQPSHKAE